MQRNLITASFDCRVILWHYPDAECWEITVRKTDKETYARFSSEEQARGFYDTAMELMKDE